MIYATIFCKSSNPVPIETFRKYGRIDHLWVIYEHEFLTVGQFTVGQFTIKKMLVSVRLGVFFIMANCPTAKNPRAIFAHTEKRISVSCQINRRWVILKKKLFVSQLKLFNFFIFKKNVFQTGVSQGHN